MAEGKAALDFIAVQCFQCNAFQAQRGGKKSPKFACKLCGARQSVQVVFARSARAADVRKAVQALNQGRADAETRADAAHLARAAAGFDEADECERLQEPQAAPRPDGGSRWAEFLDAPEEEARADAAAEDGNAHFVTSFEAARTAKRRSSTLEAHHAAAPSKRAAPSPPSPPAFRAPPAAGVREAPEAPARPPEPRWGRQAAPAPLSPRNAVAAPPAAPAAAGGGKWAAFAGAGDDEDW